MGVVCNNGAEARGGSCGVPDTSENFEGKKSEVRFMVEGGSKQSTSGSWYTTDSDLLGQYVGKSVGMGGPTDHI